MVTSPQIHGNPTTNSWWREDTHTPGPKKCEREACTPYLQWPAVHQPPDKVYHPCHISQGCNNNMVAVCALQKTTYAPVLVVPQVQVVCMPGNTTANSWLQRSRNTIPTNNVTVLTYACVMKGCILSLSNSTMHLLRTVSFLRQRHN